MAKFRITEVRETEVDTDDWVLGDDETADDPEAAIAVATEFDEFERVHIEAERVS